MHLKSFTLTGCLVAAMAALPVAAQHHTVAFDLLKDIRSTAADASEQATDLQSMTNSPNLSWKSHAVKLDALRDEINLMASKLRQLDAVRESATPEEQREIDRLGPVLKKMAVHTQGALQFLNKEPDELWRPQYTALLNQLADESMQLDRTTGEFVQLANVRAREKRIEKNLDLGAGY